MVGGSGRWPAVPRGTPAASRSQSRPGDAGDEVIVAPGDYNLSTNPLAVPASVTVHGVAGQARPRFGDEHARVWGVSRSAGDRSSVGWRLEHTARTRPAGSISALSNLGGTAEQLYVHTDARRDGPGVGIVACSQGNVDATLARQRLLERRRRKRRRVNVAFFMANSPAGITSRDSAQRHRGGDNRTALFGSVRQHDVNRDREREERDRRGWSRRRPGGCGGNRGPRLLELPDTGDSGAGTETVTAVGADPDNNTALPVFVNATTGDFRQQATSAATIDEGSGAASMLGTVDLDGDPRTLGAAPDIGADEFAVDTDGDGVPDYADSCDAEAGPASNGGCPLPPVREAGAEQVPTPPRPTPRSQGAPLARRSRSRPRSPSVAPMPAPS